MNQSPARIVYSLNQILILFINIVSYKYIKIPFHENDDKNIESDYYVKMINYILDKMVKEEWQFCPQAWCIAPKSSVLRMKVYGLKIFTKAELQYSLSLLSGDERKLDDEQKKIIIKKKFG